MTSIANRSRLALVITTCLVLAGCKPDPTPIVTSNVIAYGQTAQGHLSANENRFLFVGTRGDDIVIEFATTREMPLVAVLDPAGDSVGRVSADIGRLERFRLPTTGQFTIAVGAGTGDYTLSLRLINTGDQTPTALPTPTAIPIKNVIGLDESRTGSLKTGAAEDIWVLNGQAGIIITIRMDASSGEIDPALRLFAPDGSLLASDNKSGGGHSAMIAGVRLPSTGTYFIRASGNGRVGDYTLSAQRGAPPTATVTPIPPTEGPTATPTITPTVVEAVESGAQIRIGQTIRGEIHDAQQVDRFAVFGPAGAVISIGMFPAEDSKLIPSFIVYAPDGDQVGLAAGSGGAIMSGYTLPSTGAYVIYARGYGGGTTGVYTLSIGDGLTLRDIDEGTLTPDVPVRGYVLRTGDRELWSLDLPANAMLSLETGQSKFDPVVEVIGPDGKPLAAARASGPTHVVKIQSLVTAQQGRHQIRVSAVRLGAVGSYSLSVHILKVMPTPTFSLALDETINAEVDEGQRYTYTFKGVPGEIVLIQARERTYGGFDPVVELYGPSGRRLAMVDDASADNTDAILQIALDDEVGTYTAQVYGYAMTPGAFTLRIKSG